MSQSDDLFEYLAHGSEKHRKWLKSAIEAYFNGDPKPPKEPPEPNLGKIEAEEALQSIKATQKLNKMLRAEGLIPTLEELQEGIENHDRSTCKVDCCILCYGESHED